MKAKALLAVPLSLVLALGAACGGDDDGGDGPATGAEGETAPAEDVSFELRVGNLVPFTGDLSPFGEPVDAAAKVAAELANEAAEEAGYSGATVSIVASEDTQTDSTAAVEAATKLVQSDNVNVIMGALASSNTIPVAQSVAIPNGVLQISPASTSPAISDIEDEELVWRTPPSDALQGQVLARAVADEFGEDSTINTGTRNDAYGTALIEQFRQAWTDGGGTIGRRVRWNPEAATFDTEARQLTGGNPDGWVIIDFPETWAKVGPALVRAGGWDPARTFTADGLRSDTLPEDVGNEATVGMHGTAPTSEGAPAAEAFGSVFEERAPEGVERQTFDAHAFDAIIVAYLAAFAANSADPGEMKAELQAVSGPPGDQYTFEQLADALTALANGDDIDYEGASGPVDFDENGDPTAALYEVWQFTDQGEIETLDSFEFGAEEGE